MTYKTKQSREILSCLQHHGGSHVNVPEILKYLEERGSSVGIATVYRHLEKMEKDGIVRKYILDGKNGACFQYVEEDNDCHQHYHLKCEQCGELIHLQCDALDSIEAHILEDHGFLVNPLKTVFYGTCEKCAGAK